MARPCWAGDLSNEEWSHCAVGPLLLPLAASKKISGSAFPDVPADILSGGRARRSSSGKYNSTDLGPKREGREREPDLEVLFLASAH
jgi:hypothetical protein